MSNATVATNYAATAPLGCLSEHLDYFSESIASKHPIADGDFDDIFGQDFDLVFDPDLILGNVNGMQHQQQQQQQQQPQPVQYHQPQQTLMTQHHHQQHQQQQQQAVPIAVPSAFVPPPTTQTAAKPQPVQATSMAPAPAHLVTPSVTPKPIVSVKPLTTKRKAAPKTTKISRAAPAVVSPTTVTAVFETIPTVTKSSPRKRSYAAVSAPVKSAPIDDDDEEPIDESNLSFQEQEDLRRERNRHHAKRSRMRKRNYMNQLEEAVMDMRKENERLFDLLGMDSTRAKADMAKEEERKATRATSKFITGLKQPRNRVLDNTTLAFLRELWK